MLRQKIVLSSVLVLTGALTASLAVAAGDVSRALPWSGGDSLAISVPAQVRYTQGPAADIRISGPQTLVDRVVVRNGQIRFDRRIRTRDQLDIVVTLPNIRTFALAGSQQLDIAAYNQPTLDVSISGSGRVKAVGVTGDAKASISGSGDIDLAALRIEGADVSISGSGSVRAGPRESARVSISGSGNVDLTSRPERMDTKVSGSGRVRQVGTARS